MTCPPTELVGWCPLIFCHLLVSHPKWYQPYSSVPVNPKLEFNCFCWMWQLSPSLNAITLLLKSDVPWTARGHSVCSQGRKNSVLHWISWRSSQTSNPLMRGRNSEFAEGTRDPFCCLSPPPARYQNGHYAFLRWAGQEGFGFWPLESLKLNYRMNSIC